VAGPVEKLRGELLHHPYADIADHLDTIDRYTTIAANELFALLGPMTAAPDSVQVRRR